MASEPKPVLSLTRTRLAAEDKPCFGPTGPSDRACPSGPKIKEARSPWPRPTTQANCALNHSSGGYSSTTWQPITAQNSKHKQSGLRLGKGGVSLSEKLQ
ncbi:hypothetical protein SKAU_G00254340 [Synaphobranchus kaupii]|uniref:Uncharacterized protein n=1 Tax=Synaphobranchus kaupii TaxID=118154 RepID=A0A9Q1F3K2_SYNKA|nr:hypothetical protein SKAU_G00254340 [Synaphobranchus kaupii]